MLKNPMWPFWKWHCRKSIGFFPCTQVMCQWTLDLILKAKLKLESGNWKIQYGRQAAILNVTSHKINRLLPIATHNMHMKFESEIPKQTWVTLRKPCRLQTDRQTDGQSDSSILPPPPPLLFSVTIGHQVTDEDIILKLIQRLRLPDAIALMTIHVADYILVIRWRRTVVFIVKQPEKACHIH